MGWVWTTVADISELLRGVSYRKHEASEHYRQGTVPILRAGNIYGGLKLDKDLVFVPKSRVSEAQYIQAGDVVLAMSSGSSAVVGKAAQARTDWRGGFGAFCGVLRPTELVNQRYFGAFFGTKKYRDSISELATGTNINNIRREHLQDTPIPLPPLAEQRRIADAVEEQLSCLDAGVAALGRARVNLKRYRTAVLKAAVEGRLTESWREENPHAEPASELLKRILKERRERWEKEQLAASKRKGKKLPKGWRAKYKEPTGADKEELPGLPEGWCWSTVNQLGDVIGGLTKNQKRASYEMRMPFLRVANVYADELRLEDVHEVGVKEEELDRALLREGDLLIVEGNGSPEQIGRVALWNGAVAPCVHQNHLIKVRFPAGGIEGYVLCWLLSPNGREHIGRVASSTSGLHTLSISKVQALPVPLPPLEEQARMMEELKRRLSVVDRLRSSIEPNIKRAARLRQSVLKCAFEGKLVPQDPAEEPATELLERIRAERERSSRNGAKKKVRKKKAAEEPDPAGTPATLF